MKQTNETTNLYVKFQKNNNIYALHINSFYIFY